MTPAIPTLICSVLMWFAFAPLTQPATLLEPHAYLTVQDTGPPALQLPNDPNGDYATKEDLLALRETILDRSHAFVDGAIKLLAIWLAFLGIIVPVFGALAGRYFYKRFRGEAEIAAQKANEALAAVREAKAAVQVIHENATQAQEAATHAAQAATANAASLDALRNDSIRQIVDGDV